MRTIKIIVFGSVGLVFCFLVIGVLCSYYEYTHRAPSVLCVHVETLPLQAVTIESHYFSSPLHFEPTNQVVVSPISYGIYRIGIQLTNGQSVWSEYYHCDAGVRRRVDIYVTPSSGRLHFREMINQTKNLFEGETRPEDATEQEPFRLSWI